MTSPPPFEITYVDADEIDRYPRALEEMFLGERVGMIVRRVFAPDFIAEVAARLGRGEHKLPVYGSDFFKGRTFGKPVIVYGEDLSAYFSDGAAFPEACRDLFRGGPDYQARIEEVLGRMSGGRPVAVPMG
jgi:hypothetical protein